MKSIKIKHNYGKHAFTLVEMLIVLIIMGILLLFTIGLSGTQIQKIQNKLVKESIISELQTRYSRNLGSSSYAGVIYDHMDITLTSGLKEISFNYEPRNGGITPVNNIFTDKFMISKILINDNEKESIILRYYPYQIACDIPGESEGNNQITIISNINDNQYYCFEIKQKNCRLTEVTCDPEWIN